MHFRLSEPLCGTLGFRRTQFEIHCSIPCKYRISSQNPRRYPRTCKQNVSTYSGMTIMCYSHVLLSNKSCHRAENSHSKAICPDTDTGNHPGPMNFPKTAKDGTQTNTLTKSRNQISNDTTKKRNGVHRYPPTVTILQITGCTRLDDVRQELKKTPYECLTIKCRLLLKSKHLTLLDRIGEGGGPLYSGKAPMKSEHTDPVSISYHVPQLAIY